MTTVYLVTSGSYSDFGVDGVFSTKESAELFMRSRPKSDYDGYNDIDERTLDPVSQEAREGYISHYVKMRRNGDVVQVNTSDWEPSCEPISWGKTEWVSKNDEKGRYLSGKHEPLDKNQWLFSVTVWAKDEAHAIKIANERRIQAIAEEGVTG